MSDNLLDTTDIFKIKSFGNSPLNENIDSQHKMEQIIAEFDENIREVQTNFNVHYDEDIKTTSNVSTEDQSQTSVQEEKSDSTSNYSSSQNSSKVSTDECEPIQEEEPDLAQASFQPFKEILQCQIKNSVKEKNEQTMKQKDSSFSIKDDVFGGVQLSYVDFSKQIFQQYKMPTQVSNQQQNQPTTTSNSQPPTSILRETTRIDNKENSINNIREDCLQKGMGKIKELGDTIKSSIIVMHEKFNEVKTCVSSLVDEDKYKDVWDNRLNEFYNKLFCQASKALFVPNVKAGTPSKILVQKPQSVYRFTTKNSVSKPLSLPLQQNKKPGSVTKFNAPSMLSRPSSVLRGAAVQQQLQQNNKSNDNTSGGVASRQKSFTVQKFNINKVPTPTSNQFGILKNSKDIKKDSTNKTPQQQFSKPNSTNKQSLGKENLVFFKK